MPLFEYVCRKCGYRFEALVLGSKQPACPKCQSSDLQQEVSAFAMGRDAGKGGSAPIPTPGGCGAGGGGG